MQNERTRTRKNQRGEIALHGQEGERDKRDNLLNTKSQKNNTILKNIIISSHIGTRTSEGRDCVTWTGGERDKRDTI